MIALPRVSTRAFVTGLSFLVLFLCVFWPTFVWMAERFDAPDSFYSHGWLIPLASAWLAWQRRERVRRCPSHASFSGLALLAPSLLLYVVATWWHLGSLSGLAMVSALWGLAWMLWGWPVLWALRFPMLFLLFMVPLPGVLLLAISFQMKLAAATLATHAIHLLGVHAQQAGSTIHVPGVSVMVDDTCSGLRSLISLLALSTLWISLMPPSAKRWHKLTVVAASLPIALVANMVRIIGLVLLAVLYGPRVASGFLHYGSGLVVFGVALAALAWLSRRLAPSYTIASPGPS